MRKTVSVVAASFVTALALSQAAFAVEWPNNLVRHGDIRMDTPSNYEPSGLVWNKETDKLFTVSDDGKVTRMNLDGTSQETDVPRLAGVGTDFEAITIVNHNSSTLYIGLEHPDSILEYDWDSKEFAGKRWDLTSVLTGANNLGLEGLTFVPNQFLPQGMSASASGGWFFAGVQRAPTPGGAVNDDYLLYAFDIDLSTSGRVVSWRGIPVPPNTPRSNISDLYFSTDTGTLFVLYDDLGNPANRLIEMRADGTLVSDYTNITVPHPEGVAVVTEHPSQAADIYFASDSNKLIGWFSGFSVTYLDTDADGVDYISDCNDRDRSVSSVNVFYLDADSDGLGSDTTESLCVSVPPAGYVTNSDDTDDHTPVGQAPNSNRILDEDFEGPEVTWKRYGTPTLVEHVWDENKNPESSHALHVVSSGGGVQKTQIPVVAGHTYELRYETKVVNGTLYVRLGNNNSNADFGGAQQILGRSPYYVTMTRRFTAPESSDFRLVMSVRGEADVYVDHVSIVEVASEADPNLINDSDFESPYITWRPYGTPTVVEKFFDGTKEPAGSQVLHLLATGGGVQKTQIPVVAGRTYELRYEVKVVGGTLYVRLGDRDSNADFEASQQVIRSSGNYVTMTRRFVAPNSTDFRLVMSARGEGNIFIDNVSLVEVQ